jgi:hypothetical protein
MGYNVHDVLRKKFHLLYKIFFKKINFWLWFEIVIIFKNKTLNLQAINTLSKILIYSKIINKKNVMYLKNYMHLLYNLQKKFKYSFVWKSYFWTKKYAILFKSNVIGLFDFVCTQMQYIQVCIHFDRSIWHHKLPNENRNQLHV